MILLYPVSTEKAIKIMEMENKITFVVDKRASKEAIANSFAEEFGVKPSSINTQIKNNKKIAVIKLKPENQAADIASKLGLM